MNVKKNWKTWLRWGVSILSIALLAWTLKDMDFAQLLDALKSAQYLWLIPAVLVYWIAVTVRTLRWQLLLKPHKKIPLLKLFPVVCVGYMGNNIYPARAGEILRAYVLKEREDYPISSSLMTIIVERIFDGIVVLGFVFITFPLLATLIQGDVELISRWAWALSIAFGVVLVILVLLVVFPGFTNRVIEWGVRHVLPKKWHRKAEEVFRKFFKGLESLRSPKDALLVLFLSIVIWLIETCTYWCVMQAFSLQLNFYALMMLNGAINLFTLIPAAPGYVGTFELAGKTLLTAYGIPADMATGYTLLLHATLWLPITLMGAVFFFKDGFRIQQAREAMPGQSIDQVDKE